MRLLRLTTLAIVLAAPPASARTWVVGTGGDFPLIAPAIAAAEEGDVVVVRSGVYREDLVIGRRISLVGEGRPVLFGTGAGTVIEVRADGCVIEGFVIEGSGTGLTNRMDAAIQLASNRNKVRGNHMRRIFYGVVVVNTADNEIAGNTIEGLEDKPFGRRGDGIFLYRAPRSIVTDNHVIGQRDGIYFQYTPRGRAERNVVERSRYGLHDMFSDHTVIASNSFRDSSVGANIMNSRDVELRGNRFERNRGVSSAGLSMKQCDDSRIEQNVVADNGRGFLLDGSSTNRFIGNTFVYNDTAVHLFASAEANLFSGNTFDSNWTDVVIAGSGSRTSWADQGRGNTWNRYIGFDYDGDGLGDSPHPLLGPFERIEGRNAAARLFLQSPAATALALMARVAPRFREDLIDPAPAVASKRDGRASEASLLWFSRLFQRGLIAVGFFCLIASLSAKRPKRKLQSERAKREGYSPCSM